MNRHARNSTTVLLSSITLCTALAAGCYGSAPPHPTTIPLPELSDEAVIDVHSETTTTIEDRQKESWTCPAGHADGDPACSVSHYTVAEPVTRTESKATYGASPINYAQFKVLTDPDYDAKVARLDKMRERCKGANTPRIVGASLMIGGAIGWIASAYGKVFAQVGTGMLIGGAVSYGFGYYGYGGKTCNEARALYAELDFSEESAWESAWGVDTAAEMKRLAEEFNNRGARQAPGESLGMRTPSE